MAIRLTAPRLQPGELDRLDELLASMDTVASAETFAVWDAMHQEFHRLLVSHAGGRVTRSVSDLGDYCERYRRALLQQRPGYFFVGAREHAAIVSAVRRGDVPGATSALARHLGRTALTLLAMTDPTFDPIEVREALRLVTNDAPYLESAS